MASHVCNTWQRPMHVGHMESHVCDTWHAMCHHACPFKTYKYESSHSVWGGSKFSLWGEQQREGGGREKRKGGKEKIKGGKERRKGGKEIKGKKKIDEERGGREEKERGKGRSVAQ